GADHSIADGLARPLGEPHDRIRNCEVGHRECHRLESNVLEAGINESPAKLPAHRSVRHVRDVRTHDDRTRFFVRRIDGEGRPVGIGSNDASPGAGDPPKLGDRSVRIRQMLQGALDASGIEARVGEWQGVRIPDLQLHAHSRILRTPSGLADIASIASTPTLVPRSPTIRARAITSSPLPQPASSTRWPGSTAMSWMLLSFQT